MPLVYNPIYSIERVASCPSPLCRTSETPCGAEVARSKRERIGWYVPKWSKRDPVHARHFRKAEALHKGKLRSID
jgi:hypothetical protein